MLVNEYKPEFGVNVYICGLPFVMSRTDAQNELYLIFFNLVNKLGKQTNITLYIYNHQTFFLIIFPEGVFAFFLITVGISKTPVVVGLFTLELLLRKILSLRLGKKSSLVGRHGKVTAFVLPDLSEVFSTFSGYSICPFFATGSGSFTRCSGSFTRCSVIFVGTSAFVVDSLSSFGGLFKFN